MGSFAKAMDDDCRAADEHGLIRIDSVFTCGLEVSARYYSRERLSTFLLPGWAMLVHVFYFQ